ncbi:MAG: O-methyltransferase [Halioglobus sp.]
MQFWRFFAPSALGFILKNLVHGIVDKLAGNPPRPTQAAAYVQQHAMRGDASSVLQTLDDFARTQRWLMSVGPEKGPLVQEMAGRLPANPRILELGAYCGYSAVLLASTFGADATIVSVEVDSAAVEAARANVDMAGLSDQVEFIHGPSSKVIETLEGSFDLVFLDHWKDRYKPDLQRLEERGLVRSGTIVVADNVGDIFGDTGYLGYVRECGRYASENRPATIEYTSVKDAVEISTHQ